VFGMVVSRLGERWLAPLAAVLFFLITLPYVFFNSTRPLIAMQNISEPYSIHPLPFLGKTGISSIFYADQQRLLFANWSYLKKPYVEIANDIRNSDCKQVGLRIDSHDIEYTFWWLLNAPQSGTRIESLYYGAELARYADPTFKPCAIICTICETRTRVNGLNLSGTYDGVVKLFVGDTYSPNEDQ
jgi:hypothetical protein